jgi:hypothetical protein
MIFSDEDRKLWPPTKTDYRVGDRVKIIDTCDEFSPVGFLGFVGTITAVHRGDAGVGDTFKDPYFEVTIGDAAFPRDGFWSEELRPAMPGEVSAPLPADADLTSMGVKAALIGVFRPGKQ